MKYKFDSTLDDVNTIEWNKNSPLETLKYAVGSLMYVPATHTKIAEDICNSKHKDLKALSFCLEDAIIDSSVEYAENNLYNIIKFIYESVLEDPLLIDRLPLMFIRVRSAEQMDRVFQNIKDFNEIITGFIFPKFDLENSNHYIYTLGCINAQINSNKLYVLPILESESIINAHTRMEVITSIKQSILPIQDHVLNVRIGGNDFCNYYGFRREKDQIIYDISVIKNILADIMNIFGRDYVISAPVWEYFGDMKDDGWLRGLKKELRMDRLNGFIGKTAIHPTQLLPIQESLIVNYDDYLDAKKILNWDNKIVAVEKGISSQRMNEVKVHRNWAEKTILLSQIYGVKVNKEDNKDMV